MKKNIIKSVALVAVVSSALLGVGCSKKNVSEIKSHATNVWESAGFQVVGYEGYQYSTPGGTWGGEVWYIVKKKDSDTLFHGFISKWGDEYHIYNLKAIDAISGK